MIVPKYRMIDVEHVSCVCLLGMFVHVVSSSEVLTTLSLDLMFASLLAIAKHFRQGRQEDAHEFLRYFVDGLQKSCLHGCSPKLDPHSKATTAVHQIFGGYHRSQGENDVICATVCM